MAQANKGKAQANTIATVAKVLLGAAGMLPPEVTVIQDAKGNKVPLPNPLHAPNGASKRAMARAVLLAVESQGYKGEQASKLAGILLVLTGVGYCHSTGKVLIGEVRGSKGLSGYIKPSAAWWGSESNKVKANGLGSYAATIVKGTLQGQQDYNKAIATCKDTMDRYILRYGAKETNLCK